MTYQEKQQEADMEVRVFKFKIQVRVWLLQAEVGYTFEKQLSLQFSKNLNRVEE